MNTASVPVAPHYEAMYNNLREESAHMKARLTELIEENKILQVTKECFKNEIQKLCTEREALFSKVEIYEFCVRAFTGMGEKGKGCECKDDGR